MIGEIKERWVILCEEAAIEQDPKKLLQLVEEINRLLAEERTLGKRAQNTPPLGRAPEATLKAQNRHRPGCQ